MVLTLVTWTKLKNLTGGSVSIAIAFITTASGTDADLYDPLSRHQFVDRNSRCS